MPSMTRHLVSAAALVLVFAAGRHFAPKTQIIQAPPEAVTYGEEQPAPTNPRDDLLASVRYPGHAKPILAMITVISGSRGKDLRYASGFVIMDDVVASATHALPENFDPNQDHLFVDCDGRRISGTLLYHDRGQDVMLIGASCGKTDLIVDTTPLDWNVPLVFAAYNFTFTDGDATRRLEKATPFARPTSFIPQANLGQNGEMFEEHARKVYAEIRRRNLPEPIAMTGTMVRGNSGGVIYRASDGNVVGLATIIDRQYNRMFVVPAATLHDALRKADLLK